MAAQVQIQSVDAAGQNIYVVFKVVLSGNYVAGGDPLNFTGGGTLPATQDPAFIGLVAAIESSSLLQISVESQGGAQIAGASTTNYSSLVSPSGSPTTINPQTGVKLKVQALGNNFSVEHAAAAYEAAYLNDIITGFAVFNKLL